MGRQPPSYPHCGPRVGENIKTAPMLDNDHQISNTQCPTRPIQFPLAINVGWFTNEDRVVVVSHTGKRGFQNPLSTRNCSLETTTTTPMTKSKPTRESCGIHPRPREPGGELIIFGRRQQWAWPGSTHFFSSASQRVQIVS